MLRVTIMLGVTMVICLELEVQGNIRRKRRGKLAGTNTLTAQILESSPSTLILAPFLGPRPYIP